MARPFITTIALVAGVGLTIAGCTTALDSPDADTSTVESETSATPAELPEVDSSVLEELAADNGGSLTPEQMPSNLGASHAGGKRDGHEGQAMRGENRGEGHGPGHRS